MCTNLAPGKVKSLEVTSKTTTTLVISWQEPDIQSPCMVTSYEVKYEEASSQESQKVSAPLVYIITNVTEITLSELAAGSKYDISVAARSGTVYGEQEMISAATTDINNSKYDTIKILPFTDEKLKFLCKTLYFGFVN